MATTADAVVVERFSAMSSDGRTMLAGGVWLPPSDVDPVLEVQLVHGMAEHIGRYDAFARFLASKGAVVVGHDHAGHGASAPAGEESSRTWGILKRLAGAEQLVDDVELVHAAAAPWLSDVPRAVFGHSMGSFVARVFAARYGSELAAAVFCGTGWQSPAELVAGKALADILGAVRGWDHRSKTIDGMAVASYGKGFEGEPFSKIAWLSRDVEVRRAYDADPACGFMFSVGAYHELFRLIEMAQDPNLARNVPHSLPVLVVSGTCDPVGGARAVAKVAGLLRDSGVVDVTERLYEGARHEILNETNKDEVMGDIASWLFEKGARR